jgi:hypothetical protein
VTLEQLVQQVRKVSKDQLVQQVKQDRLDLRELTFTLQVP